MLVVVTVGTLVWIAERSLRRDLQNDIAQGLEHEARLVRTALPADSLRWQDLVRRFGQETGHRITVIDRSGRVRADSDFPPGPLPATIENHAARAEVRQALAGGSGSAVRHSTTVGRDLIYLAVPGGPGVVRVASDLSQVRIVVCRHAILTDNAGNRDVLLDDRDDVCTAELVTRDLCLRDGAAVRG